MFNTRLAVNVNFLQMHYKIDLERQLQNITAKTREL